LELRKNFNFLDEGFSLRFKLISLEDSALKCPRAYTLGDGSLLAVVKNLSDGEFFFGV